MRRRSWSWFVVLVGLLTAALVTASLAAPPADLERRAATLAPDEAPTAEELQRQMAEADRAIALLYEARRSPKARAERERSRAAYSGLSQADALALARSRFRAFLVAPVWEPVPLDPGERVKRLIGRHGAIVESATGDTSAVDSLGPLLPPGKEGVQNLVDLSLRDAGSALEPVNAAEPVSIAKDPAVGVRFTAAGFGLNLSRHPGAKSVVADDRVFYGGVRRPDGSIQKVHIG